MNKKVKVSLMIVIMILLTSCSSGMKSMGTVGVSEWNSTNDGVNMDFGMVYRSTSKSSQDEDYGVFTPPSAEAPQETNGNSQNNEPKTTDITYTEKLIYKANLTVETQTFEEAIKSINEQVKGIGGFIESQSQSGSSNYYGDTQRGYITNRSGYFKLRVPHNKFYDLVESINTVGNVTNSSTNVSNISQEYYDNEAKLRSYRVQEERLLELLGKATTVEDMIKVEDKLVNVQYNIDSITSRQNNLDKEVEYSTINVEVIEVEKLTPTPELRLTFFDRLGEIIETTFNDFGKALETILFIIIYFIPYILILGVLVFIALKLINKHRIKKTTKELDTK